MKKWIWMFVALLLLAGCGSSTTGVSNNSADAQSDDAKYQLAYKGMRFFAPALSQKSYALAQVDDQVFNALSESRKYYVADKLLTTLFWGYPQPLLASKINAGDFISSLFSTLHTEINDKDAIETLIRDREKFYHTSSTNDEVNHILSRFYVMQAPDRYFLKNWIAYILTQTIMFSPAYELESSHEPNIARVYNALVRNISEEATIEYSTYLHMISSDNWRRFRSPEDNGREMMEIYALLFDDKLVPLAGKALQNWKLDRESDTLVIGLNENTKPLSLFGTTVVNGDDFYRELAKSDDFSKGVVSRLVDFFFPQESTGKKEQIIAKILQSKPERWEDILLQIVFSKAYLLETQRPKSAEELFYSLTKKMEYKHYKYTFHYFARALDEMHQATMKYKLGKLERVPLDTLSFITYHKYIREQVLLKRANPDKPNNYKDWDSYGFRTSFIGEDRFVLDEAAPRESLHSLVHYLFMTLLAREPKAEEVALFDSHILKQDEDGLSYASGMNLVKTSGRTNATLLILDYISRLTELYQFKKVQL